MKWMPIETAPRDGSVILTKMKDDPDDWADRVFWQREGRCCILGSRAGSLGEGWTSVLAGNLPVDEPQLWMPLPEPPK
jgi:hypothetical protein